MTAAQFEALATLLRLRAGAAQDAARLVLVHGHQPGDAAALTGLSAASVSNAVSRIRRGLELARQAAGGQDGGAVHCAGQAQYGHEAKC